ncbi:nucleotidyltransferase domain-containing protein [Synechococcus sp. RedBA-s]|uniref:nucleotidyltransferase domain-containing protein n=1 Tax=Synechococcus sp. RedBA-s TaxID=2823741 RepID=UPI0020CF4B6F|nr:nucleotidyltransferase domain-containing protein [Synechococcus sp. RedBA-s]MCP9801401.1 nucleotidyltransferase domain-containing protein [Synechococcus sp. RedBA-s]
MSGSFNCNHAVPGLPAEASDRLLALLGRDPEVEQVWLYGSRAMGRHRSASDIDLTLKGPALSHDGLLQLMAAVDDLLLPWQVDLFLYAELTADFRAHVDRIVLLLLERAPSAPEAMPR